MADDPPTEAQLRAHPIGVDDIDDTFVPRARRGVASVVLEREAVLLDGDTNVLHLLNRTGTLVWARIDGRRSVAEIVAVLAGDCWADPEVVRRDVVQLICELDGHELLDDIGT